MTYRYKTQQESTGLEYKGFGAVHFQTFSSVYAQKCTKNPYSEGDAWREWLNTSPNRQTQDDAVLGVA